MSDGMIEKVCREPGCSNPVKVLAWAFEKLGDGSIPCCGACWESRKPKTKTKQQRPKQQRGKKQ